MAHVGTVGPMMEYVSNIEFSLNFEERDRSGKQISAKIKKGDRVFYDGLTAKFKKINGEEITGKTSSLGSAIASNWLYLAGSKPADAKGVVQPDVTTKTQDYDLLKGGNFDEFVKQELKDSKIIREEDRIVKRTSKTEVTSDQVEVRTTMVSSSTASATPPKPRNVTVSQAEDYGADRTFDITMKKKGAEVEPKKNTFRVDGSTPTITEDSTLAEVKRATVTQVDGSQDARVVRKVGEKKTASTVEVEPQEAKVIGKTRSREIIEEGIIFNKSEEKKEKEEVTVSAGTTPIADLSGVKTQDDVKAAEKSSSTNYLELLPANWAELHWTKKEKFVMGLSDKVFIKFILTVESLKIVQVACKKRLTELANKI